MPPFPHLEFHRSGIGLVPGGPEQDTALYVVAGTAQPLRSCTCKASKKKTCDHLRDLSRAAPGATKMPEQMRRELRELGLL